MAKPSIVVSIPLVWSIRNVLRSGLAARLAEDFHLIYAAPAEAIRSLEEEGVPRPDIWKLETGFARRRDDWIGRMLRSAHEWRRPTASDPVFARWNRRARGMRSTVADAFFRSAGRLASSDAMFGRLEQLGRQAFGARVPAGQLELVRRHRPVAGLSTSCVAGIERGVFHVLQECGIPTVAHMLSFDNLTSRGFLPIGGFARYLVWSERMRSELTEFFGVPPARVEIVGTPQFDFHMDARLRLSQVETTRALGVDADRQYVLYCANHWGITPSEPSLVADLVVQLGNDERTRELGWVVRLHPMDRYDRWDELQRRFAHVRIVHPWPQLAEKSSWGCPSAEEIGLLGNSLRHAAVVLTVASTTVLDAAVLDTPVICLGYHPAAPPEENEFYHDAHFTHHFRPIVESGAAPLARAPGEVRDLVAQALRDRHERSKARMRLVGDICGPVDGGAAERIASAVRAVAGGAPGSRVHEADRVSALR